jgi:poly-gamma-glutamate capsule biosynthesis protein CapA/YwtB (metallophosphatase superfamily)
MIYLRMAYGSAFSNMLKCSLIGNKIAGVAVRKIQNTVLTLLACLIINVGDVPAQADEYLTITAVGDIMMGSLFPEPVLPPDDGKGMFDPVKNFLKPGDIVLGNLEGPFLDDGITEKCKKPFSGRCYAFRMPEHYVEYLKKAGFNAVGIANNHTFDFGQEGISTTLRLLKENNIQAIGGRHKAVFTKSDKKIIILGFSYSSPSPHSHSILDLTAAAQLVRDAKKSASVVIVSFHGGAEGKGALHISDADEIFLDDDRGNVMQFARTVVDAGADLVIGHGPHVLRAMEVYKNKLILYSLGNFLTYGMFNIRDVSGISAIVKARLSLTTGDFIDGEFISLRLLNKGIPQPAPGAIELVRGLIMDDLPSANIDITPVKDSPVARISLIKKKTGSATPVSKIPAAGKNPTPGTFIPDPADKQNP